MTFLINQSFLLLSFTIVIITILLTTAISSSVSAFFGFPHPNRRSSTDLYSILGVSRRATQKEINKAFRKLSMEWHPDSSKHENAKERYAEMLKAKSILGDPEKRRTYDVHGVIEGEDGNPTSEQMRRQQRGGGGGPGGFPGNPWHEFMEEMRRQDEAQRRARSQPIQFNEKNTPELTMERFAKLREFRGPKLFAVFCYMDHDQDSRIFSRVWDTLSSTSSAFSSPFDKLITFMRINVGKDQFMMDLAGIRPEDGHTLPLIFLVRDGKIEMLSSDCIMIMPQSVTEMSKVTTTCLMEYANTLMRAANDDVVKNVIAGAGNDESLTDGVLRRYKQVHDFVFVKYRYQTVLLIDKGNPTMNAVPAAAAVRSQFADVVIGFVDQSSMSLKQLWNCKQQNQHEKFMQESAWLFVPSSSNNNINICNPTRRFSFNSNHYTHGSLVRELANALGFSKILTSKNVDVRLFLRPSVALSTSSASSSSLNLVTGNSFDQIFGAGSPASTNDHSGNNFVSNEIDKELLQYVKDNQKLFKDGLHRVTTHVVVEILPTTTEDTSSSKNNKARNSKNLLLTLKDLTAATSRMNFINKNKNNQQQRFHTSAIYRIDPRTQSKLATKLQEFSQNNNNEKNLIKFLVVSIVHEVETNFQSAGSGSFEAEGESSSSVAIRQVVHSRIRLASIPSPEKLADVLSSREVLVNYQDENNNNNNIPLIFDSTNKKYNREKVFAPFRSELMKHILISTTGDDNGNEDTVIMAGGGNGDSTSSSAPDESSTTTIRTILDDYDYSFADFFIFVLLESRDQYPPSTLGEIIMSWLSWGLRRIFDVGSLVMIVVIYFLKQYVLGPLWRRLFGRGNNNNNNNENQNQNGTTTARDVPQNVMKNSLISVYGLQPFDRAEIAAAKNGNNSSNSNKKAKTFLVAVNFSDSSNQQEDTNNNSTIKNELQSISTSMNGEILLRGCSTKNTKNISFFDQIATTIKNDDSNTSNNQYYYQSPNENVLFVALRVMPSSGKVKGTVMTKERKYLKSFVERVLDGSEAMKLNF